MAEATPDSNYTVAQGDTLSAIAEAAYDDAKQWPKIYNANSQVIGANPNLIRAGEVLYIPPVEAPMTYTVQTGDTLTSIAQFFYSDGNQWHKIYNANSQVIGKDPNLIRPGEVLTIP